jgi:orotidine-5'-phosphate decarboxylase
VRYFKVGLELFVEGGLGVIGDLRAVAEKHGAGIFLDLKLKDIPETVKKTVHRFCEEVEIYTIHLSGGPAMVRAAVELAVPQNGWAMPIGVTVLTSMDEMALFQIGYRDPYTLPEELVGRLTQLGVENGVHGYVCSAKEVALVRAITETHTAHPRDMIICPGVRMPGQDANDQVRIDTPRAAIEAGADFVVVGRYINTDHDPAGAAQRVLAHIRGDAS